LALLKPTRNTAPNFRFSCYGLTHTGLVRDHNEDSFACVPEQNLWLVADGMGGHASGDFASRMLAEQAQKFVRQQRLILDETASRPGQATIGSTLVSLFAWNNLAFVMWAGDSRAYLFRSQRLSRMTEDHSLVEELVRMGQLDADKAEEHPASNVVLNAVGIENNLYFDLEYSEIHDQDLFLLCSDGLYKDLSDDTIEALLKAHADNLEQACSKLLEAALEAGGSDNCTVVLVKAEQAD